MKLGARNAEILRPKAVEERGQFRELGILPADYADGRRFFEEQQS
jgi:hypothetical protein